MAYTVSNNYKNVIYSGDARNKIKILFNNVELQEADRYCEKATIKSRIIPNGAKRFSLNNFISKEVEIILHDINTNIIQDKVSISIGTLVGNSYEYVPIGIFNIQGTPTTDKNKITIKLRDNSVKFDFNYNAKPLIDSGGGSATKLQILQDICTKANVTCNISSFIGSTDSIGIYDNTITARQYIADIAEQAGRIATINRSGELIFVNLNSLTTWNIPLSIVEKYEIGKAYRIGKVVYEDAIRKYETASTNYDTLYLDSSNPYISSQSQVNSILQQVNSFEIDSVKTGKILGNPAIDGYDIINVYDDKVEGNPSVFKTLATNELVYTGVLINTFDTQIGEEERKENVSIVGEATFKKWATTNINNINGEIDIQAGKIDNVEKEINPTKDTSGSSIYLGDSTDAELVNFEMEGKTTQATREGYNLVSISDQFRAGSAAANITPSVNSNGELQVVVTASNGNWHTNWWASNQSFANIENTLATGDTFTIVFTIKKSSDSNGGKPTIYIKSGMGYYTMTGTVGTEYSELYYTGTWNDTNSIAFHLGWGSCVGTYIIKNWMLKKGTYKSYEPYGVQPSPDYPSELVSVGYRNLFDSENWYNTLHNLNNESMTKEIVDGIEYYKFRPSGINNYQYMLGKFKENTQYTLTCKARQYVYQARNTTGFIFAYTDGTTTSVLINQTTTEYDYKITSQAGKTISYIKLSYYNNDYQLVRDIQLTEGTQEHSYISYGKYGIEVKTNSANYFDASKIKNSNISVSNDGQTILMPEAISGNGYTSTSSTLHELAPSLQVGDTVYLQFTRSSGGSNRYIYLNGSSALWYINTTRTITQSDLDGIVALYGNRYDSGETGRITLTDFRIVKVQNTEWEQFKSKTYLYTLNQPLRGIGDTKDLLYIKNGMLYVDRKIGSIVLDGTQSISLVNWRPSDTSTGWIYSYNTTKNLIPQAGTTGKIMSTQLSPTSYGNLYAQSIDDGIALYNNNAYGIVIRASDTSLTTKALVNNYLSQHPMIVDYALAEPTTEELGQVDMPSTYKTTTHIDTIDINEPNMNITYVRDTQLTNYVEEHISQIVANEEGITERVQTIEDSDYDSRINAVERKQTDTDLTIDIISTNIDRTSGEVRSVTTDTGFTFNENGLNIKKSDTDYNTLIDNTGTYYKDGETIISMTNKDGFLAKDFRLQGQHYYSYNATNPSEPLASENYDFVDERIEVDGEYAYATFYNGEV